MKSLTMKFTHWVIIGMALVIIALILFQPKKPEVDITPFEIQIAEQNLIIDSLAKSNRATIKRIQEDSIIQAEERASFLERYTRLKGKLGQQRVRIDTVIRENPEVARYVELADSTIQVQGERIDTLERNLSDLRVDMSKVVSNLNQQIAATQVKFENEKKIADTYRDENRKIRRGNRLLKAGAVVIAVGSFFLGSQL
jgi:hypothetical protein